MAEYLFENNAVSYLSASIGSGDVSFTVESGGGAVFPNPGTGQCFMCVLQSGGNREIVKCTSRSTDTFTVDRAQEDTTALAWGVGTRVYNALTAETLNSLLQKGVYTEYAGDPTDNVTPEYIGEECFDAVNKEWYKSVGLTSTDWKIITPGT